MSNKHAYLHYKSLSWDSFLFILFLLLSQTTFSQTVVNSGEKSVVNLKVSDADTKKYIDSLISKMTLEEKISMVHGAKGADSKGIEYVGYVAGIPRLGISPLRMQNGPSGAGATFTSQRHKAPATAFPVPIAQSSTWNTYLLNKMGVALGLETKAQAHDVLLAPGVNIIRVPEGGRNFEYYSEDPYLSALCGVSIINGIQSVGIMASVKHFAANNQETNRLTIDEQISERALREIYLPAFEAAVKEAKVATIMAAYNKINGVYCAENDLLLRQIAKNEWGFKGFIMTDWDPLHKAAAAANAGLDMEMSGYGKFGEAQFKPFLLDAVKSGAVKESTLNEMVFRILSEMNRFGLLKDKKDFPKGEMNTKSHQELALELALESAVLLKNENQLLPLNPKSVKKIALFGDALKAIVSGEGSSKVVPFYSVTPYDGIKNYAPQIQVTYYKDTQNITNVNDHDVAIVFIYKTSSEGNDRETISLESESQMIDDISKKYKHVIVVLRTSAAYTLPWIDKVDAIFQTWYPGQEEGNAIAQLLYGAVSPSGKLPITFGKKRSDFSANTQADFPGINKKVNYSEGIYVGYRYFEKNNIAPLFPFGYGLSYTKFKYSKLKISSKSIHHGENLKVSYTITNTGKVAGAEVSQLYIGDVDCVVERPKKELKGFNKVFLKPGESKTVEFLIKNRDLAYWDVINKQWKADAGLFNLYIGASSSDIRLTKSFSLLD